MAKPLLDPKNPIVIAVEPLRVSAVEEAEAQAKEYVAQIEKVLSENDWDLNKVAPEPVWVSRMVGKQKDDYEDAKGKRAAFLQLVRSAGTTTDRQLYRRHEPGAPEPVKMSPELVERFIRHEKENAAASYELYAYKLTKKIGPVKTAQLLHVSRHENRSGGSLWQESHLDVDLADGTRERWYTKRIINRSVLGNSFYQWPTRQVAMPGVKLVRRTEDDSQNKPVVHMKAKAYGYTTKLCVGSASGAQRAFQSAVRLTENEADVTCQACLKDIEARKEAKRARLAGIEFGALPNGFKVEHDGVVYTIAANSYEPIQQPAKKGWKALPSGGKNADLYSAVHAAAIAAGRADPAIAKAMDEALAEHELVQKAYSIGNKPFEMDGKQYLFHGRDLRQVVAGGYIPIRREQMPAVFRGAIKRAAELVDAREAEKAAAQQAPADPLAQLAEKAEKGGDEDVDALIDKLPSDPT